MQPNSAARLPSFRSTPAAWLESVLLKEEEEEEEEQEESEEAEKETLTFTQLLSTIAAPSPSRRQRQRQNYEIQDYPPTSMPIPNPIAPEERDASPPHIKMDMFMFEDSAAPCRVRAKRGCATHPRSIAERVRRTRISDRIRKLQELVPNMDKQTNTADMLHEAVAYVKFLQKQIEELTEHQRRCRCMVQE
ncbi:hypothetical protein PHAVU_011G001800 [Phaseolus vulgaris]|uniref:BHLH domain-containing protein n=2 Tax=Phaseolus vulgaris TaxID=3885 RepID=V7AEM8_PHAVU|nr:hypothetical protein PHAVU_011G001800g [Phaseolus vulgaris]ESW03288.1 hypothetical protein PHAVU_011G001800g [Phaseolus vulgaris]